MSATTTSVIVLGWGDEPYLEDALHAIDGQLGDDDELILVDNGVPGLAERSIPARTVVIGPPTNRGFAGGCNTGAARSQGDTLVFVNSDALVLDGAIAELAKAVSDPTVGLASGSLRLAATPDLMNSAGNPVQYLGVTWAGACGEPAERHAAAKDITSVTGGFFAVRRTVWDQLGGFHEEYFAYHEDTDLSLRAHLMGLDVRYVPTALAHHNYEFSRNQQKMYLLERNRLLLLLTDYPPRTLRRALPLVVLTEPAFLAMAVIQGWGKQKLRSWWWIVRNAGRVRQLRNATQSDRRITDAQFADLLVARIEPEAISPPPGMGILNAVLAAYWRLARPR